MFRQLRMLQIASVAACLVTAPWTSAFGRERHDVPTDEALARPFATAWHERTEPPRTILNAIRSASFDPRTLGAPSSPGPVVHALQQRGTQSVATTTESKLLLGIVAGGLIVGGMSLMAYGATSTCKSREGESPGRCDRKVMIGALSTSGGTAMLLLWALSR